MKRWFKVVASCGMFTFLIALLLSCAGQGPQSENRTNRAPVEPKQASVDQQQSTEQREEARRQERERAKAERQKIAAATKAMNEAFDLGGFRYRITDVGASAFIGSDIINERPDSGGVFIIVSYKMENLGNETRTVLADDLTLLDSEGREFRPSSRANTALMTVERNKDFLLSELQPGIVREAKTVFEIPRSSTRGLILVVHEKGLLGTGKIRVDLESKAAKEEAEEQRRLEENREAQAERLREAAQAKVARAEAQRKLDKEHPEEAARKKYSGILTNAKSLIKAKVYGPARDRLRRIITEARGTQIAAEAKQLLESLPETR